MEFEEETDFIDFDDDSNNKFEESNAALSSGTYFINGIKVRFPFKPYPSQIGMMDRVIRSLQNDKNHALLESPTGSGKTMALLCGVLSWMEEQKIKYNLDYGGSTLASSVSASSEDPEVVLHPQQHSFFDKKVKKEVFVIDDDMDEDFAVAPKNSNSDFDLNAVSNKNKSFDVDVENEEDLLAKQINTENPFIMPKVYFASRTHKQLAQSIRELKRSGYVSKFTVLASRKQYCVNKEVKKALDINEACKEAMNPDSPHGRCMFSNRLQKFFDNQRAFSTNLDIEDLVSFGKERKLCPYFLAREASQYSEIILCPYNYLIDPMIRNSMGIDLKDAIVIIDEAHNIEDVCRSAGSFEWSQETVFTIELELKTFIAHATADPAHVVITEPTAHREMLHVCSTVLNWINGVSNFGSSTTAATNKYQSFETKIDIYEGEDIKSELLSLGMNELTVSKWSEQLGKIEEASRKMISQRAQEEDPRKKKDKDRNFIEEKCLSSGSCRLLSSFFFTISNIFENSCQHLDSFRLVKYSTIKHDRKNERREEIIMGFWCLSSDVIFRPIASMARSIILTSGTLSPMDTFSSELRTSFPLQLEANHVIDQSQIFVGVFPRGPNGIELVGNYQNINSFNFQDDISQSIFEICKITPFGVLCFLPSYALLEKLLERMQRTGLYRSLQQIKEIVLEPRAGPAEDFEKLIKHYYQVIRECRENTLSGQVTTVSSRKVSGAIMFAVYRGKVSEGLDFADENARAVINVGIPYPAFKDPKVTLKKEFNDRNSNGNGKNSLIPGTIWYETQAFRALNQALGRCIRHRNDWGAVIFLDQRFNSQRNIQKLSKWVRPSVKSYNQFTDGLENLKQFMKSKGSILPVEALEFAETTTQFNTDNTNDHSSTDHYVAFNAKISVEESQENSVKSTNLTVKSFFNNSRRGKTLGASRKRPFI